MTFYPTLVTTFGALSIAAVVLALGLGGALAARPGRAALSTLLDGGEQALVAAALGVALIAALGSLYLSEVAGLVPCRLCWYQRIAMYPLVPILAVGLIRGDRGVWRYALPLAVIGLPISIYHVIIQWRPALDVGACEQGVPCTARYVAVYGFISIPTMAGSAFLLISLLLLALPFVGSGREGHEA